MKIKSILPALALSTLLLFASLASAFSWPSWTPWKSPEQHIPTLAELGIKNGNVMLISHQAELEPSQAIPASHYPWTKADGTPFPYEDWLTNPPIPNARSVLTRHGARVACWPSTGGIWIKQADPLDMEFLGVDRFRDMARRTHNVTEENEFCARLKMLGADFWRLPQRLERKRPGPCETLESCFEPDIKNEYLLAWPEDSPGVCYVPISIAKDRGGELMGGWYNARTMSERCNVIVRLSGWECDCPKDCYPDLKYLNWGSRKSHCGRFEWDFSCVDGWSEHWIDGVSDEWVRE